MRKFVKLILAISLLSMVFTTAVFAEGSVSAGDNIQVDVDNNDTYGIVISDMNDRNIPESGKDTVNSVNGKANQNGVFYVQVADFANLGLSANVIEKMNLTNAASNLYLTKFFDIYKTGTVALPDGGIEVTLTVDSALVNNGRIIRVYHMIEDASGNLDFEIIEGSALTHVSNNKIKFRVNSLSPFALLFEVNSGSGSGGSTNPPVVNTAAGDINHTNSYMGYAAVACVALAGALFVAGKKLIRNAK